MDQKECVQCQWWARPDRPHETFRLLLWEWDVDLAKTKPALQEGEIDVSVLADQVDYPKTDSINLMAAAINDDHLDHVDLTVPLLLGILRYPEDHLSHVFLDGHHRVARAIRDGIEKLPCKLIGEADLLDCMLSTPDDVRRPSRGRGKKK